MTCTPVVTELSMRTAVVRPAMVTEIHEDTMKSVTPRWGSVDRPRRPWTTTIRAHATMRGSTIRTILAAAVLMPTAALTIVLGQPFAISAIASTVAIVLHAPQRYHRRPQLILSCYAVGIAVSATISLSGAFVDVPPLLAAAVAAVIIVASPAGRLHPPTACIPLQVLASIPPLALVERWLTFTGLSLTCLLTLWLLTARPLSGHLDTDPNRTETPCATA
jgi:hypothetical protein